MTRFQNSLKTLLDAKTLWEFVNEGEEVMQVPEKEKIAASSCETQKDFNKVPETDCNLDIETHWGKDEAIKKKREGAPRYKKKQTYFNGVIRN